MIALTSEALTALAFRERKLIEFDRANSVMLVKHMGQTYYAASGRHRGAPGPASGAAPRHRADGRVTQ